MLVKSVILHRATSILAFIVSMIACSLSLWADAPSQSEPNKKRDGMVKMQFVKPVRSQTELSAPTQLRSLVKSNDSADSKLKSVDELPFATAKVGPLADISLSIKMKSITTKIDKPKDLAAIEFAKFGEIQYVSSYPSSQLGGSYSLATSSFCHRPLYFEQLNLERHGHHWGFFTPVVSAAHFYGTIPTLPYRMALASQRACIYEGSVYRPGSPAMHETIWPPLRVGPSVVEAAAITGMFFLIP